MTQALAKAGLNLRGLSAAGFGGKFVSYVAFDTAGEAGKAVRILRAL